MQYRENLKNAKRIVIKVGTSTLSYPNGRLNFRRIEKLAYVLSALRARDHEVILVSSGAIGVGAGRLGLTKKPEDLAKKQALAALGQAQLIKIYQRFFEGYNQVVAQLLLTKDVMTNEQRHANAQSTLNRLIEMDIIPIINENDTISTYEIEFGDNDTLSAMVAELAQADLLVMLSDIEGLFSADPRSQKDAEIIHTITEITPQIEQIATGSGNSFGTGGMVTKITAAKICSRAHIDTVITSGEDPEIIFRILKGEVIGTHFIANPKTFLN